MRPFTPLLTASAVVGLIAPAAAQESSAVDVHVTYTSGDSVFLDRGRNDDLEVGDLVVLQDAVHGRREGNLVAVSATTSRATLRDGRSLPQPGTSGRVVLPPGRATAAVLEGDGPKRAPDHPGWTRPPEERDPDTPLLAPAFSVDPWDRPLRIRGRAHVHSLTDIDRAGDRDSRYSIFETGIDLDIRNLFARGGQLGFSGDLERRVRDIGGSDDETEDFGRIDRFFYRWGEGVDAPLVVTLGRFVPRDTPEFGLLDGVETSVHAGSIGRFTLDLGALPALSAKRTGFDDKQVSIGWRWVESDAEKVATTLALQQTWHDGDRDRRLVIGKVDWSPAKGVILHGDTWLDVYDGDDRTKSGMELTEAHLSASWRVDADHTLRASTSLTRWPELLRDEFPRVTRRLLDDRRVSRGDVGGGHRLGRHVRLNERVGIWSDEDASGVTADATVRLPGIFLDRNEPYVRLFRTDGSFESGMGLRVGDRHRFDDAAVGLAFETSRSDVGHGSRRVRNSVLATIDLTPALDWSLSIETDARFGDDQDGVSLSVYAEYRF